MTEYEIVFLFVGWKIKKYRKSFNSWPHTYESDRYYANAMETATKDATEQQSAPSFVNKVKAAHKKTKRPLNEQPSVPILCKHYDSQKIRLKTAVCHSCYTKGHITTVWRKRQNIHKTEELTEDSVLMVNSLKQDSKYKVILSPSIGGKSVSIYKQSVFKSVFVDMQLSPPNKALKTYS